MNPIKRLLFTLYYKLKFWRAPNIIYVRRYIQITPKLYKREEYQIRPFIRQPKGVDDTAFVGDVHFDW